MEIMPSAHLYRNPSVHSSPLAWVWFSWTQVSSSLPLEDVDGVDEVDTGDEVDAGDEFDIVDEVDAGEVAEAVADVVKTLLVNASPFTRSSNRTWFPLWIQERSKLSVLTVWPIGISVPSSVMQEIISRPFSVHSIWNFVSLILSPVA